MTPQERDVLLPLLDKLRQTIVPDKDAEADQLIRQTLQAQPDAAYILAQTVLMQDYALHAAQDRIHALEQAQPQPPTTGGGFLSGLFGGPAYPSPQTPQNPAQNQAFGPWGAAPTSPYGPQIATAVQPHYAPPSFLRSAAQTAAGIAGGALLFQGIEGLFGMRNGFGGRGFAQPEIIQNNYYDQPAPDSQMGVQGSDSSDDISDHTDFDNSGSNDFGGDDGFNI